MNDESYVGAVGMFVGSYVPQNWLPCDGRTLTAREYPALFSIIGDRYGGDGKTNFCLPNFTGVFPTGMPANNPAAKPRKQDSASPNQPGTMSIGLGNLPAHSHTANFVGQTIAVDKAPVTLNARTGSGSNVPEQGSLLGAGGNGTNAATIYVPATPAGPEVGLGGASVSLKITPRGDVAVDPFPPAVKGHALPVPSPVQAPFLEIVFCICVNGIYPSRP